MTERQSVGQVFDVAAWVESSTAVLTTCTPSLLVTVSQLHECLAYTYTSHYSQAVNQLPTLPRYASYYDHRRTKRNVKCGRRVRPIRYAPAGL